MLEHYLCCYCFFEQDDWVLHLSMTEFIYNNVKHSSTDMLSFEALYVYSLNLHFNIKNDISEKKTSAVQEQVEKMHKIQKLLEENLTKTIKQQKKYYNKKHVFKQFTVDNQIILKAKNLHNIHSSLKLNNKFTDFFVISNIIEIQVYHLWLLLIYRFIHLIFHVSLLKLYYHCEDEKSSNHLIIIESKKMKCWNNSYR